MSHIFNFNFSILLTYKYIFEYILADTYPRAESDEFEDALKSKAHCEGEVHVGKEVRQ